MNILITGGTGFFGKALLPYLLAVIPSRLSDFSLTILTRRPEAFLRSHPQLCDNPCVTLHKGDILHLDSLPQSKTYTHVIHAAADSTNGSSLSPLSRFDQIVRGTHNLLDFSVRNDVKQFLFISSGAVYGTQPPDLYSLSENWSGYLNLANPSLAYGHAKRAAEHLCHLFHNTFGLEVVIARCFAFIGPDLPLGVHFAIGNFIRDALFSSIIKVSGDGSPVRSYLYQSDLAHWLWTLLIDGRPGEVYNVGSDEAITIYQLAHLVRDLISPEKTVQIVGYNQSNTERSRYIPDITKAQVMHSLNVTIPLQDAILRTARAHHLP